MRARRRLPLAFTIVELMVSVAILALLLLVLSSMTDATRRTWTYTSGKLDQFRGAREAFESLTRKLSQATLNTYWDYDNPAAPTRYLRQSELRFISGSARDLTNRPNTDGHAVFFQAPLGITEHANLYSGTEKLLNTCGYFVEFGDDRVNRPPFITEAVAPYRERFRLMEMIEPSDRLSIYRYTNGNPAYNGHTWFSDPLGSTAPTLRVLAENVLSLVVLPRLTPEEDASGARLAPDYNYDSTATNPIPELNPRNQLPPVIQVSIVALDEASFSRFQSRQQGKGIPPALSQDSLFRNAGDLRDQAGPGYHQDLHTLQTTLRDQQISYRVFNTSVSLKAAKWSRAQSN